MKAVRRIYVRKDQTIMGNARQGPFGPEGYCTHCGRIVAVETRIKPLRFGGGTDLLVAHSNVSQMSYAALCAGSDREPSRWPLTPEVSAFRLKDPSLQRPIPCEVY